MKKVPKNPRRKLSPRRRRYAVARGKGKTRGEAAQKAGYRGARARKGVTGWELERDPRVLKLMADTMAKDMSESEVKNRRAAQARGELPTKVVVGSDGVRQEFDADQALTAVQKILGMNSETHRLELPEDKEEALEELQTFLKLFGVEATIEEITAKVEAAGGR